jgi:uncharacterized repeat protein (TIGR04138 family)
MQDHQFSEVIDLIRREDGRFGKGAYLFLRRALDFTLAKLEEEEPARPARHVKGPELLEGIREYALEQFGPLALTVLHEWNIRECRHFGEIVFQLVDYGVLGKTEDDCLDDFSGGYDFREAFLAPFKPVKRRRQSAATPE